MKIWVTKYALTEGILEFERKESSYVPGDTMVTVMALKATGGVRHFHGQDWHTTRESAVARAEVMRAAKIVALCKKIQKLKAMSWRV